MSGLPIGCQWVDCTRQATAWRLSIEGPSLQKVAILNELTGAWQFPVCDKHEVPIGCPPPAIAARMDRWDAHLREVLRKSLGLSPERAPWEDENENEGA